jgi:hypothetical protein
MKILLGLIAAYIISKIQRKIANRQYDEHVADLKRRGYYD